MQKKYTSLSFDITNELIESHNICEKDIGKSIAKYYNLPFQEKLTYEHHANKDQSHHQTFIENEQIFPVKNKDTLKKINEANKLATIIIPKFLREVMSALKSLEESAYPIPLIGPINGEISIAPMMTAVELLISPIEATMIEQIKIQILMALKEISFLISTMVFSLSTTS